MLFKVDGKKIKSFIISGLEVYCVSCHFPFSCFSQVHISRIPHCWVLLFSFHNFMGSMSVLNPGDITVCADYRVFYVYHWVVSFGEIEVMVELLRILHLHLDDGLFKDEKPGVAVENHWPITAYIANHLDKLVILL